MTRILVDPEELQGVSRQFQAAAGQLRGAADRFTRAAESSAWEVRQRSNINQQTAAARSRAEALARQAEELARYLLKKAQDFQDADTAGQQGLAGVWTGPGSSFSGGLQDQFPGGHRWRTDLEQWAGLVPVGAAVAAAAVPSVAGGSMRANITRLEQTDEDWAKVDVGPSTYFEDGCTLTSIAMVISYYRPDIKVDEKQFMENLANGLVNNAGEVVWYDKAAPYLAENYGLNLKHESLEGSQAEMLPGTMDRILANLKQAPPVPSILGVCEPMHWVVVSGFTGDPANPKPEDFLLNDPGLDRKTLADLLTDDKYKSSDIHALVTITKK